MRRIVVLTFLVFFISLPAAAQIIYVPADQPTIQAGINAAANGEVVLVAEGTYYENINFSGKAITVASQYYFDGDERHIKKTIIDGSQPANPDFASVVTFMSGEDTNSVLCGFTITGGLGTKLILPPEARFGGGVLCIASSAKICHNIFKDNIIGGSILGLGGGIATGPPGFPVPVVIENNVFTKNEVYGIASAMGGGIANYLPGRIAKNKCFDNYVYCEMGVASGGGIATTTLVDPSAQLIVVSENRISHNKTECTPSDTIAAISAGLQIGGFNIVVKNNTITNNEVISSGNYCYGAGVVLDYPDDRVVFSNNLVSNNFFSGGGGCLGGGVAIWDGDAKLYNNVISSNQATYGAGIYVVNDATVSEPEYINNTITKNEATMAGGGIYYDQSEVTLMNSILWENYAPADPQIGNNMGSIDVSYSDIQEGWAGTGNMNVNPKLISNYCLLNQLSSCIDAGNPDMMYNDPEDPFNSGYALFPAQGTLVNDMGAYGGAYAVDWLNMPGFVKAADGISLAGGSLKSDNPEKVSISQYPNPFNPTTRISYILPEKTDVTLKVYDILGNEITTLVNEFQKAGSHEVEFSAQGLASGIYLYRLQAGSYTEMRKMIMMK